MTVISAMELQVAAERQKRARVLESEGFKQSDINIADGKRQAKILASEAEMQELINTVRFCDWLIVCLFDWFIICLFVWFWFGWERGGVFCRCGRFQLIRHTRARRRLVRRRPSFGGRKQPHKRSRRWLRPWRGRVGPML